MILQILEKIYRKYSSLYPRVSGLRGTYRFKQLLRKRMLALDESFEGRPRSIFEKGSWDNLIILDACRHDFFEKVFGESDHRITAGSSSSGYIKKTFSEGSYDNVVYVTANPHFYPDIFEELTGRKIEEVFHAVYNLYETHWDNDLGVVPPEAVVDQTQSARKLFPDKKIISHFMQPHTPFIPSEKDVSPNMPLGEESSIEVSENPPSLLEKAEKSEISRKECLEAYKQNLEYVKPHAVELGNNLSGKTIITADHGEMLGKRGVYGHTTDIDHSKLRKVPWFEF